MLIKNILFTSYILLFASLSAIACPLCNRSHSEEKCNDCKKEVRYIRDTLAGRGETTSTMRLTVPKVPGNPALNLQMKANILSGLASMSSSIVDNSATASTASVVGFSGSAGSGAGATPHMTDPEYAQYAHSFMASLTSEQFAQIDQSIIPILETLMDCDDFITTNYWLSTLSEGHSMADPESHHFVISYENGLGWFFINFDFSTGSFQVLNWSDHYLYHSHSFLEFQGFDVLKAYLKDFLTEKNNIKSVFF